LRAEIAMRFRTLLVIRRVLRRDTCSAARNSAPEREPNYCAMSYHPALRARAAL
jgi:hypothetical protein